ncbi:MAG: DUF4926 domain-containing protein [Smithella sp.]|nr:DUF4926 domain-containing protein [Smithella sp.]
MNMDLYQRVSLTADCPGHGLKKGDIVTLVDYVDHPDGGEKGCVLEVFNALGESIDVVTLPVSGIEPLSPDEILSIRHYSRDRLGA